MGVTRLAMSLALVVAGTGAAESPGKLRLLGQKLQLLDALLSRTRAREDLTADDHATLDVAETAPIACSSIVTKVHQPRSGGSPAAGIPTSFRTPARWAPTLPAI